MFIVHNTPFPMSRQTRDDRFSRTRDDFINYVCPRTIAKAGEMINEGLLNLSENLQLAILSGCIGDSIAIELLQFLKLKDSLPDIDQILKDPDSVIIPDRMDILYIVCLSLVEKIDKLNIENVIRFLKRCPVEFMQLVIFNGSKRNTEITKTAAYIQWINENHMNFTV